MPKFIFTVKDKEGKEFKNVMEAVNQGQAIHKLQEQDYFIISLKEVTVEVLKAEKFNIRKERKFSHKKAKHDDLLAFAR